jgi:hypothetical protein
VIILGRGVIIGFFVGLLLFDFFLGPKGCKEG